LPDRRGVDRWRAGDQQRAAIVLLGAIAAVPEGPVVAVAQRGAGVLVHERAIGIDEADLWRARERLDDLRECRRRELVVVIELDEDSAAGLVARGAFYGADAAVVRRWCKDRHAAIAGARSLRVLAP